MACNDTRPLTLKLNDNITDQNFANLNTGGWEQASLQWFEPAPLDIPAGKVIMRLESGEGKFFLHFNRFKIEPINDLEN